MTPAQDRLRPPGLGFTRDFETQYPNWSVYAFSPYDSGSGEELYLGGEILGVQGQVQFLSRYIVRWDGLTWSRVGWGLNWETESPDSYYPGVYCLQRFDDGTGQKLYIGGDFNRYWSESDTAWITCNGFVTWDGSRFQPVLPWGFPVRRVSAMCVYDDGSGDALYLTGMTGGRMYRYSSQGAVTVGSPMSGGVNAHLADQFIIHDDGAGTKLYAGGKMTFVHQQTPNGPVDLPANGLVSWDGVDWTPILGPWVYTLSNYITVGRGRLVSFDDGTGPALYVGFDGGVWRYRYGIWENLIQTTDLHYELYVVAVYDDGSGPALFVSGRNIPLPGTPPGQYVKFAKYQGGTWTQIGPSTSSVSTHTAASRSIVYDFGEGPDLYMSTEFGIAAGGQHPIRVGRYRGVHRDVAPVCGGDGSLADCPCGPRGIVGRGCPNSADGQGGTLVASGRPENDSLRLTANALPASSACLLLQGSVYDYTPTFLGRGVMCASGTVLRLSAHTAEAGSTSFPGSGESPLRALSAALGDTLAPGSVRTYQVWYRDFGGDVCMGGPPVNLTNGIRVVW